MDEHNHKTVIVLDHREFFKVSSNCPVVVKNATGAISTNDKSLWTCSLEAAEAYCRIVWDLFPNGKLIQLVVSDFCSRTVNTWNEQNIQILRDVFAIIGEPSECLMTPRHDVINGISGAMDAIAEPTNLQRQIVDKEEGAQKKLNKGRIICITSLVNNHAMSNLENVANTLLQRKNDDFKNSTDMIPIDNCHLVFINLIPSKTTSLVSSRPVINLSTTLTSEVHVVEASNLQTTMITLLQPHYDLVSTTISGIPSMYDQNANSMHKVELLHSNQSYNVIPGCNRFLPIFPKEGIQYKTIDLKLYTPSDYERFNLNSSIAQYPATLADVKSPESCYLNNFVQKNQPVFLEMKNVCGEILTSHMLKAHCGSISLHTLGIPQTNSLETVPIIECQRVSESCLDDFVQLMGFISINDEPPGEYMKEIYLKLKDCATFWPLNVKRTIVCNMRQFFRPMMSAIAKNTISTAEIFYCKSMIFALANAESKNQPLLLENDVNRQRFEDTNIVKHYQLLWKELEILVAASGKSHGHEIILDCIRSCSSQNWEPSSHPRASLQEIKNQSNTSNEDDMAYDVINIIGSDSETEGLLSISSYQTDDDESDTDSFSTENISDSPTDGSEDSSTLNVPVENSHLNVGTGVQNTSTGRIDDSHGDFVNGDSNTSTGRVENDPLDVASGDTSTPTGRVNNSHLNLSSGDPITSTGNVENSPVDVAGGDTSTPTGRVDNSHLNLVSGVPITSTGLVDDSHGNFVNEDSSTSTGRLEISPLEVACGISNSFTGRIDISSLNFASGDTSTFTEQAENSHVDLTTNVSRPTTGFIDNSRHNIVSGGSSNTTEMPHVPNLINRNRIPNTIAEQVNNSRLSFMNYAPGTSTEPVENSYRNISLPYLDNNTAENSHVKLSSAVTSPFTRRGNNSQRKGYPDTLHSNTKLVNNSQLNMSCGVPSTFMGMADISRLGINRGIPSTSPGRAKNSQSYIASAVPSTSTLLVDNSQLNIPSSVPRISTGRAENSNVNLRCDLSHNTVRENIPNLSNRNRIPNTIAEQVNNSRLSFMNYAPGTSTEPVENSYRNISLPYLDNNTAGNSHVKLSSAVTSPSTRRGNNSQRKGYPDTLHSNTKLVNNSQLNMASGVPSTSMGMDDISRLMIPRGIPSTSTAQAVNSYCNIQYRNNFWVEYTGLNLRSGVSNTSNVNLQQEGVPNTLHSNNELENNLHVDLASAVPSTSIRRGNNSQPTRFPDTLRSNTELVNNTQVNIASGVPSTSIKIVDISRLMIPRGSPSTSTGRARNWHVNLSSAVSSTSTGLGNNLHNNTSRVNQQIKIASGSPSNTTRVTDISNLNSGRRVPKISTGRVTKLRTNNSIKNFTVNESHQCVCPTTSTGRAISRTATIPVKNTRRSISRGVPCTSPIRVNRNQNSQNGSPQNIVDRPPGVFVKPVSDYEEMRRQEFVNNYLYRAFNADQWAKLNPHLPPIPSLFPDSDLDTYFNSLHGSPSNFVGRYPNFGPGVQGPFPAPLISNPSIGNSVISPPPGQQHYICPRAYPGPNNIYRAPNKG